MNTPTTQATLQIAVLDRGFVYVGQCHTEGTTLIITNARCVRRWGTTNGLGELAMNGPTAKTQLDAACTVRAPLSSVVHQIDCNPTKWPEAAAAQAA